MFVILQKMCSKQATGCFLVYYATFLIQKMCVQSKRKPDFLGS